MKKYKFYVGTGYAGVSHEEVVELPDEMTEKEVEEEFKDWVWNQLDGYWKQLD